MTFAIAASVVTIALVIAWLLFTVSGRDAALRIAARSLPDGALGWQRADGVLAGTLTLHDLRFRYSGLTFTAKSLRLQTAIVPLLARRVRIDALAVDTATLDLPVDHTPQPPPRWPDVLPTFDLPLTLDLRAVALHDLRISRAGAPLVAIADLRGGVLLAPGKMALSRIAANTDRGDLRIDGAMDARRNHATRLRAAWSAPADAPTPANLQVVADGNLDRFQLDLSGSAPGPLRAHLLLTNGRRIPDWSLQLRADRFDPRAFAAIASTSNDAPPWTLALDASGTGGRARISGGIAQAAQPILIARSQIAYADGVLDVQPLVVRLLDGRVQLRGRLDFRPDSPTLAVDLRGDGLRWRAEANTEPVQAGGDLKVNGTFDEWSSSGTLDLLRGGQRATIALSVHGDRRLMRIEHIEARTPAGSLQGSGRFAWLPRPQWDLDATLDRFDPGYFAPGYEGRMSGRVQGNGSDDAQAGLVLHASVDGLAGTLRGRTLAGGGRVDWLRDKGTVDADLRIGGSHIVAKGSFGSTFDATARFDPLRLDDLVPNARGRIAGDVTVRGALPLPAVSATLSGKDLRWQDYGAANLTLAGHLASNGGDGTIRVDATGIAGIFALQNLHAQLSGTTQRPRLNAQASGSFGTLELSAAGERGQRAWSARIAALHLSPTRGPAWTLAAPTNVQRDDNGAVRLSSTCMQSDGASICASADWPRRANVQAHGLPLAWLDPWLARPDVTMHGYGTVEADAQIAPAARGGWSGHAQITSASGGIETQPRMDRPLLGYSGLNARITLAGERVQASLHATLSAGGTVQANVVTGVSRAAPLQGDFALDLRDITWLELFSTDLAAPKGRFGGHLAIGGSLAQPTISGHLQLSDFQAELPALGITLRDGHVGIDAAADGTANIDGVLRSGDGSLRIGGGGRWNDLEAPLTMTLAGDKVRIADTPEVQVIASPDLRLGYGGGVLSVTGKVDVPAAKIDLERLDSTVTPSPDVVVLDPRDGLRSGNPIKVAVDLQLALGKDVKLKGFGLDGSLGGALRVRQPPGGAMTANGTLDVGGRYAAYGQQLDIERGRLTYSGGSFDNPALDVLAQRQFDDVTVGVQVRRTARRPQTQIVSTPAMDPTNALAYLVIGRPLQSANADDTRQISAASAALSVGSNLLAQQIGARLGLDAAGVSQSRALGGEAFTVGKYLSPRLFVSYGVALAGTGEVLTLKYLLRRGFDITIESAKEQRASINWRIEK